MTNETFIFTAYGEELDLLGDGPDDMEYICLVCGEFKNPISELLEEYKCEPDKMRRLHIADEIRDQAYFFAGETANYDLSLIHISEPTRPY